MDEARNNDELIALAPSQVIRWIDEYRGITNIDAQVREIGREIKRLKKEGTTYGTSKKIKKLYEERDALQFKVDYLCLVIDKNKDYLRTAQKGFVINGIRYKRLLGTNGGIKNSTIVFVSEEVHSMLVSKIENGRNQELPMVTAKLEAYKALTCSASTPVSFPEGVLVVNDCETTFAEGILHLSDELDGEPVMRDIPNHIIGLDASDGFGMMLPSLAARWSDELRLGYVSSGFNTRFAFEKGMVYTFDFVDFADKVAGGNYIVKDAWGDEVDIRNVELVLTTSMVKLYDSYNSCDDYLAKSMANGYKFSITKSCPEKLENERALNYQFIQSYDLNDDDIDALIEPTMTEIRDVLGGDHRKTILFLRGQSLNEHNIFGLEDDVSKALMIDPRLIDDPHVQSVVHGAIANRIREAKIGIIKVHGNYSMASGDPYALCQSMFGLDVTGLLQAGEIYNKYWADSGSAKVACFRAPMTCHNNIRLVTPVNREDTNYWYSHMKTCTIFNSWDTSCAALNGMDYDGDLVMLTDNEVLVNRLQPKPALMCIQRKASKCIPTEEDFVRSNIESFGNEIGQTTNWITGMFEVRSRFDPGTREYEVLNYRIQCGQLYQQNAIDKAKGIICKPMPREWHDIHAVNKLPDEEMRQFYGQIVADKKPYFMSYIYPQLRTEYREFCKKVERNALCRFGMTVAEMKQLPEDSLSEDQLKFLADRDRKVPVGEGPCVMNKICRRFEEAFDGHIGKHNKSISFDWSILKSDQEYHRNTKSKIKALYDEYTKQLKNYKAYVSYDRVDECEAKAELAVMNENFRKECAIICPDEKALCNIVIDLCYPKNSTKRFAWSMCSATIIENLLAQNDWILSYPEQDKNGDLVYGGERFSMKQAVFAPLEASVNTEEEC